MMSENPSHISQKISQNEESSAKLFEERFKRIMEASGATNDSGLAKALDITQGSVGTAKKRLKIPSGWIEQISVKFGVSTDWLFFGTGSMRPGNAQITPTEAQTGHASPIFISAEDAPEHGLTMVPKVKARLTAGTGSLETSGEVAGYYAFRTKFLHRKGCPNDMVLMDVVGDSMEPDIWNGDTVLIDESQREIIAGGMFAVGIEQEVFLKYLLRIPGKLVLQSRNERYAPIEVDMNGDLAGTVRIIGRVVWSCREYVR